MSNENLTAVQYEVFDGKPTSIQATTGGHLVSIPLDPANRHYQGILDAIIKNGADCFEGDVPADLQTAADAKQFTQQLKAYRKATTRLAEYILADGRPEITEQRPTGETVWDDETGEQTDVMHEVVVQTLIEALEATVEQTTYDDEGKPTTETVDNPLIVSDESERTSSQTTVDTTPNGVISFYNEQEELNR